MRSIQVIRGAGGMRKRRYCSAILVVAAMTWPPSSASAAAPFPCSDSVFSIDEAFIPGVTRVCFRWANVGLGAAMYSEELVVDGGEEFLSYVVDRVGTDTRIGYESNRVEDWLPAAYKWVARGATGWGEQFELETDIGAVEYMAFSAADVTACVGFRLYYGHKIETARLRVTGAFCDSKGDRLGAPNVQRIFDMVKFSVKEIDLYQRFIK